MPDHKIQPTNEAEPDPFRTRDVHELRMCVDTLREIQEATAPAGAIATKLNRSGWEARMPWLPRVLNTLRRHGYIRRLKSGYVITPKGKAKNAA